MSYAPQSPDLIFFFCVRSPEEYGEPLDGLTPITDGAAVLEELRSLGLDQKFREKEVRYRYFYRSAEDPRGTPRFNSWQQAFRVSGRGEVDAFFQSQRQAGFPNLEWSWLPPPLSEGEAGATAGRAAEGKGEGEAKRPPAGAEDTTGAGLHEQEEPSTASASVGQPDPETFSLQYHFRAPAVSTHPRTGREIWFNQATSMHRSYFHSHPLFPDLNATAVPYPSASSAGGPAREWEYPFDTAYGDGEEIEEQVLTSLRRIYWKHAVAVPWRPGDLLVLDNRVAAHARLSYEDIEKRKIVVALVKSTR